MKTWVIGGLAGVLVLGGLAAWMIGSGQDTDAPQVAPSARAWARASETMFLSSGIREPSTSCRACGCFETAGTCMAELYDAGRR